MKLPEHIGMVKIFLEWLMDKKKIRCAIYTRKSSEEGLEQDFNSLDAQREACEAYIKSQMHEGWSLLAKQYNDGGYSGGTMERPAFKELLKDIENDEIDIVVVYKVDRLTRSLMDFSKIIDVFDRHETSFVSITQQFNTTTSMGRLTLNILLSFAQFEREVTGERIRDKIAASKKKGMWMGGCVPLGYKKEDKKLIIDENDADKVKFIFDKYLELKSVPKLKLYLNLNEFKTRSYKDFSKGQLYHLLANKIYIGKIMHKKNVYDGEHEAIIDVNTFEKVQSLLYENKVDKACGTKCSSSSLLTGLIYDDAGNRMTPSHSNTRKRRYRYYLSTAIKCFDKERAGSISKIPAEEVEKFVVETLKEFLQDKSKLQKLVSNYNVSKQNKLIYTAQNIENYSDVKLIKAILNKVVVSKSYIEISINEQSLIKTLNLLSNNQPIIIPDNNETVDLVVLKKNIKLIQPSRNNNILILNAKQDMSPEPNPYLVNAIVKCHYYHKQLTEGKTIADLQAEEGLKDSKYIRNILNLKYISPELTEQILDGKQDERLSLQKLISSNN